MQEKLFYHWQANAAPLDISYCFFSQMLSTDHSLLLPLHMRYEIYEQGDNTGLHLHQDFYALYVIRGGRGVHVINHHPYGIARGDVYLLPPGTLHAYRDYHALTIYAFYFQPQLFTDQELLSLRALAGFWHLLITFEKAASEQPLQEMHDHRLHLPPERLHDVEAMISELHEEFCTSTLEASILTRSQFFRMLVHLARWQATERARTRGKTEHRETNGTDEETKRTQTYPTTITNVLHICEERFHEALSVPQLASYMFLSPSHFSEVFTQEVGMSPAAYIRRLRLERAQTLLRTTQQSTTTIAHDIGFRDSAQLARAFKAAFYLTPTEYRANFRLD